MASLNEGRKKSNFGTKSGVNNVDVETSRSKVQDPANTTVNPKKESSKNIGQGFSPTKDSAARYAGKPDIKQQVKVADDIRSRTGADPTPKKAASNIIGGGRKPSSGEELVGAGAKPGRGQRYRQARPSDVKSTGIGTRTKPAPIYKTTVVKQSEVSKRAARFRQSFGTPTGANPLTGAPTYRPLPGTTNLPQGVGGRAPSAGQYSKVKVSDLNAKEVLKNIGSGASSSTTTSGSKLPKIKPIPVKTIAKVKQSLTKPAPEPSFGKTFASKSTSSKPVPKPSFTIPNTTQTKTSPKLPKFQSTSNKNLKFTKTSRGSFSYRPDSKVDADPTRRRASGAAGPSSRIDGGPKPLTTQQQLTARKTKQAISPNLGQGSTSPRKGVSVSYKPPKVETPKLPPTLPTSTPKSTPTPPVERASSGAGSGAFYGAFNAYNASEREKARGQTAERQRNVALASGTGSTLGSIATTALLRGVIGKRASAFVGPLAGSTLGDAASGYVMGASASDKKWMAKQNRKLQTGVPGLSATSRSGNKSVIRDKSGKERVGYLAYKDGKPVYKTANDPSSLAYTSSNPLERIGRRTADAGLPYVSDYLKGHYGRKDDATRKSNVAAQKSRAGN
tara:strand:+ start:2026 stop:3876 length:1851 start_codon:yes stop_codon:yes gene_type:complete